MRRRAGIVTWVLALLLLGACTDRPHDLRHRVTQEVQRDARVVDYKVQEGDTWESVAESFFGNARNASRIATDNLAMGPTPRVGTILRIKIREDELDQVRAIAEARGPYNAGVEAMALQGQEAKAKASFERAIEKAPHFVDARYNLALVLLRMGDPQSAIEQLQLVRDERPQDAETAYALGAAWFHAGDFAKSTRELERALELQPDLLKARYTYALALEREGRGPEARRAFEAYLSLDSESAWADEARQHLRDLRSGSR